MKCLILEALGWHVITVWECELRGEAEVASRLDELAEEIRHAGELKRIKEGQKLQTEETARKHREDNYKGYLRALKYKSDQIKEITIRN